MKYIIDTANRHEIDEVLAYGIKGVTANPSMYRKNQEDPREFIAHYSHFPLSFLSAEVVGSYEEMLAQAREWLALSSSIVIKINFSKEGLRLCHTLHQEGVQTAMTLIFTINQAMTAINAGCDYLFPFVGRNEDYGNDGLDFVLSLQKIIDHHAYPVKVVAASIKNLHQLECLAKGGIDYAALSYDLYCKTLDHLLTDKGRKQFEEDWKSIK